MTHETEQYKPLATSRQTATFALISDIATRFGSSSRVSATAALIGAIAYANAEQTADIDQEQLNAGKESHDRAKHRAVPITDA
jgi:hypothetical protein